MYMSYVCMYMSYVCDMSYVCVCIQYNVCSFCTCYVVCVICVFLCAPVFVLHVCTMFGDWARGVKQVFQKFSVTRVLFWICVHRL